MTDWTSVIVVVMILLVLLVCACSCVILAIKAEVVIDATSDFISQASNSTGITLIAIIAVFVLCVGTVAIIYIALKK
jgi:hypothetical protein